MNKKEKQAQVSVLNNLFKKHSFAYIIGYKGVEADVLFRMRYALKQHGSVKFVKNSLAKIASKDTEFKALADSFKEVCILVVSNNAIESVKCMLPFMEEHDKAITLKAGVLDNQLLNSSDMIELGNTPSKEQSLATIAYLLEYPMMRVHHMVEQAATHKAA